MSSSSSSLALFIGTQVANWNQQRLERIETGRLIAQLQPELANFLDFFASARTYYGVTRSYADVAFRGWEANPRVSDEQFVIAAYQASQIIGIGTNTQNWAMIFGGQQLRNIEDPEVRRNLSLLMTTNFEIIDLPAVATKYREDVRRVIPDKLQQAIREGCGDTTLPNRPYYYALPARCELDLEDDQARAAAADLRAHPELARELRWHLAAVSTFLSNMNAFEDQTRNLSASISRLNTTT